MMMDPKDMPRWMRATMGAPPPVHRLPMRSDTASTHSHDQLSPTTPLSGSDSHGKEVDGACALEGETYRLNGEFWSATACWRKPTCSLYLPAAPIVYLTLCWRTILPAACSVL